MPPRVLLVDDDAAIRFAIERYFLTRGYDIHCASDAEEANRLIESQRFDVLIADLRLSGTGGVEGLDVITALRSKVPTARTILLTAYRYPGLDAEAQTRGVDVILQKPRPLSELAEIVCELLRSRRA